MPHSEVKTTVSASKRNEVKTMMILHHYEMSPFSEKVRLMMGYAEMGWASLLSPEMPPRPNIDPLSGGYRRIPVAQLGADIFCDSRLICSEMAQISDIPQLALEDCPRNVIDYAEHLEGEVFWATVLSIPPGIMIRQLFRNIGAWGTFRFLVDRAGIGKHTRLKAPSSKQATQGFDQHLAELESRLKGPFLFGEQPCHADFAAYHTLWFKRVVAAQPVATELPAVDSWYQRMSELGHGQRREINQGEAFELARDSSPRAIAPDHSADPLIGQEVQICPSDYALDSVRGVLVGASARRWIVARETDQFGLLHVHFPRRGFEIR